jgi:hypothetical protein
MVVEHSEINCPQEVRITNIENGINKMVEGMESMCDKVDTLTHNFNDAMFPSEMHPENGLINGYHNNKKHISELQDKVAIYENAKVIPTLETVQKEITKFKIWISAVVTIAIIGYTIITYIIDIYIKNKA